MKTIVDIISLDHYGRGVARIDGVISFIENALPNERVEIEITNTKKKFMEGKVISYITKSDKRCSNCEHKCGGCHLKHMNYEDQLIFKENKVKEIIKKFVGGDIKINNIISNPNPTNYRNKATFHVNDKIGYYKNKSHEIIEVNECLLVDKKINELLTFIKNEIDLKNIIDIVIRVSKYNNDSMVILKVNGNINEEKMINKFKNKVTSLIIYNKEYKTLYGKSHIIENLDGLKFIISPDSFFQVNTKGSEKLYNQVLEYASPNKEERILDLYCGTGSIGIYLSRYAKYVTGIEINKYAVVDANKNKELNEIKNIDFICGDTSKLVDKLKNNFDTIIVDPPRAGLDKNTINYLLNSNARKIVYVSCDPVTLARDLNFLKNKYEISEITPVDMFSYTYHVECVCILNLM